MASNTRSPLAPLAGFAYALMRVLAGLMFTFYGVQKIFGLFTEATPPVGSLVWFAGIIELLGGILIAAGFLTVPAAFIASGEMAVAYFTQHWRFQFDAQFFPALNRGELAVLYCVIFFFVASTGPGGFSIDRWRASKRRS